MVRPVVGVLLLAAFAMGCDESATGPVSYTPSLPDYCGTNAVPLSTTCACQFGHDWCVPDDPNDWNCCATSEPAEGEIIVVYEGAEDAFHRQVEAYLMERGLHEAIADWFTEVFAFPEDVYLASRECGTANAFFGRTEDGLAVVRMCYELYRWVLDTFSALAPDAGVEAQGDIDKGTLNTWLFVVFHELGHALVDIFDIPIVTAEEDAVDALATVLLVEMGMREAALQAALFWFLADDGDAVPRELADEHSLERQRFYDIVCLVYGSAPEDYPTLVELLPEMERRFARCENEWEAANTNWGRLLEPHLRQSTN